jgi:cold shock CspA family protein
MEWRRKMETIEKVTSELRLRGIITSVKQEKGYGFISCKQDGRDYFFHHSEVLRGSVAFKNLEEGDIVSFYPEDNEDITKGPKAQAIKLEGKAPAVPSHSSNPDLKAGTEHTDAAAV